MDVTVTWLGDERFSAVTAAGAVLPLDGRKAEGASPVEALEIALAGCMGADIVDILTKGREPVSGCTIRVSGERRETPPRRFTSLSLAVELSGPGLSRAKAERAVALSRDTYCSVWHSLAPDIELTVSVALVEATSRGPVGG